MISLSLGNLVLAYASGLLVLLLMLWGAHGLLSARGERWRRRHSIQCAHCGTLYENANDSLPACPLCSHRNERTPPPAI